MSETTGLLTKEGVKMLETSGLLAKERLVLLRSEASRVLISKSFSDDGDKRSPTRRTATANSRASSSDKTL